MKYGECEFEVGRLIFWIQQEMYAVVTHIQGRNIHAICDDGNERIFTADSNAVIPICLEPGDRVQLLGDQEAGITISSVDGSQPPLWKVFLGGKEVTVAGSVSPPRRSR